MRGEAHLTEPCLWTFRDENDVHSCSVFGLTITLKAVCGLGLLHICCIVSSSKEKLTVINNLVDIFSAKVQRTLPLLLVHFSVSQSWF